MSAGQSIRIDSLHSVRVEKTAAAVKIAFIVGGVSMFTKVIDASAARRLGDALGFASNDITQAATCAVRPDSSWPRRCDKCELRSVREACGPACEAR